MELNEVLEAAQKANVYMVSVTILEKGEFKHHLLTNNFPNGEMLRCHAEIEKLVIGQLKEPMKESPAENNIGGINQ
jgi:hypothetical protein